MIRTPRLNLVPATEPILKADLAGPGELGEALGAVVPDSWPPQDYDDAAARWSLEKLRDNPGTEAHWTYYFVRRSPSGPPVLIGVGGYKGPPEGGRVELGYSVVADYLRQGFATEAVEGMLEFAFDSTDVNEVVAHTLPHLTPSIGVLAKTGFRLAGPGAEEGVLQFAISRADWEQRRKERLSGPISAGREHDSE
jgi:RimJ/RimL family protein N-acetyltransferase